MRTLLVFGLGAAAGWLAARALAEAEPRCCNYLAREALGRIIG